MGRINFWNVLDLNDRIIARVTGEDESEALYNASKMLGAQFFTVVYYDYTVCQ